MYFCFISGRIFLTFFIFRYTGAPLRNGLTSPRSKYSEQAGPVNLAVSQSAVNLLPTDDCASQQQHQQLSPAPNNDDVPSQAPPPTPQSLNSLYGPVGPPKLSYCAAQGTGISNNVYPALNYSSLYGRPSTIYG